MGNLIHCKLIIIKSVILIGASHFFRIYIVNILICSSLFISTYTLTKSSLFLYMVYKVNYNIVFILVLFIIYPLLFTALLHQVLLTSHTTAIVVKSTNKGVTFYQFLFLIFLTFSLLSIILLYITSTFIYPLHYYLYTTLFGLGTDLQSHICYSSFSSIIAIYNYHFSFSSFIVRSAVRRTVASI